MGSQFCDGRLRFIGKTRASQRLTLVPPSADPQPPLDEAAARELHELIRRVQTRPPCLTSDKHTLDDDDGDLPPAA